MKKIEANWVTESEERIDAVDRGELQTIDGPTALQDLRSSLLARTLPAVIETEAENDHFLAEIEKLIDKDQRSPEEDKLLDLMTTLVEDFEEKNYPIPDAPPHEALQELMRSR